MIRRLLTVACVLASMGSLAAFADDPPRTISAISDRLYVASAGTESTVVLVSAGGILVADPLDLATASWLRTELSTRFPGVPVRYVVVTSARFGRASGVRMFLPASSVVAHAGVNGALVQASREIPRELTSLDANRSGRLEADEWTPLEAFAPFKSLDTDGSASLTSREVWKLIPYTENTFTDEKVLTLGDDAVRLVDPGKDGSTPAIYFPGERVLYTGSNPLVTMKGFTLTLAGRARTFAWLDGISRLEFDRIITSHGEAVPRAQFDLVVRYAHALERAAVEAYRRGQSEDGALKSPALAGFPASSSGRADVSAVFGTLHRWRADVQGAALVRRVPARASYCSGFTPCVSGADLSGAGGGVRIVRSRLGAVFEMSASDQFLQSRSSLLVDEAYAHRSARGSLLFRYGGSRPRGLSFDLLAGITKVVGDTKGADRVREAVTPVGGRHAFSHHSAEVGLTVGANVVLPLAFGASITLPVRVTHLKPPVSKAWPNGTDYQVGVGVSLKVFERVR